MVLGNEDRTGDYLPATVTLAFASEQWQRTVLVRTDKGPKLARRHFEVCAFAEAEVCQHSAPARYPEGLKRARNRLTDLTGAGGRRLSDVGR